MSLISRRFPVLLRLLAGLGCAGLAGAAQAVPVAEAGPPQQIECAPPEGALVLLDGTGSEDPDDPDAAFTYTWTGDALVAPVDGATPTVLLPPGDHTLTLTIDDGAGGMDSDEVLVQVTADDEAPALTLATDAAELWPPNHKHHLFEVGDFVASVSDDCDEELEVSDVVFDEVTSDEDENANGDGNTVDDIVLAYGCHAALIRSERQGPGDGRVYEATLGVADAAGNIASDAVTISVPKSRGHGDAVDSGDVYLVGSDTCAAVDLCPPVPAEDCLQAESGKLKLRSRGERDRMRWAARGFDATEGDMGDGEEGTDYQVCVYVDDGAVGTIEGDPAAPAGRGWRRSAGGQSYRAKGPKRAAGVQKVKLRSRSDGTDVKVSAKGDGLDLPALPVADGSSVRIQLWNSDGTCLEASFDDPHVNRPGRYKAKLR